MRRSRNGRRSRLDDAGRDAELTPAQRIAAASSCLRSARKLFMAGLRHQGFTRAEALRLWGRRGD
ncbi:MAG: hypothetical protein HY748_05825 [Elusimicrobia bacterium]|nr:hypothetical protein [Elusimicrobiota bacterium]